VKQNRKLVPIQIIGTLNTEIPDYAAKPGNLPVCTNFYPKNNVMTKRGGLTQIGEVAGGVITGLHGVKTSSMDWLYRMYNDYTDTTIEKWNGIGWSFVTEGLTASDDLRWSLSRYYYTETTPSTGSWNLWYMNSTTDTAIDGAYVGTKVGGIDLYLVMLRLI
jgi:hypothetical protein